MACGGWRPLVHQRRKQNGMYTLVQICLKVQSLAIQALSFDWANHGAAPCRPASPTCLTAVDTTLYLGPDIAESASQVYEPRPSSLKPLLVAARFVYHRAHSRGVLPRYGCAQIDNVVVTPPLSVCHLADGQMKTISLMERQSATQKPSFCFDSLFSSQSFGGSFSFLRYDGE